MSKFAKFMKSNKAEKPNGKFAPTKSLCDDKGDPLEWEFKHITSKENESIRESCMIDVPIKGKPNMYRPKLKTSQYLQKMIIASVVFPDLYDAELQDSYNAKTPEELLFAMVDDPGEFNDLGAFVQQFQGFNNSLEEKVDEAKN